MFGDILGQLVRQYLQTLFLCGNNFFQQVAVLLIPASHYEMLRSCIISMPKASFAAHHGRFHVLTTSAIPTTYGQETVQEY